MLSDAAPNAVAVEGTSGTVTTSVAPADSRVPPTPARVSTSRWGVAKPWKLTGAGAGWGGALKPSVASAAPMLRPGYTAPERGSAAGDAVDFTRASSDARVALGAAWRRSANAPATTGAAIDVPDLRPNAPPGS